MKAVITNEAIMYVYVLPIYGFTIRLLASENNYLSQKAVKGLTFSSLSGFVEEFCFISVLQHDEMGERGRLKREKQF